LLYDAAMCKVCVQLEADQRDAMRETVLRRIGWPCSPHSTGSTIRFAFLDHEGLVTGVRLHHGLAGHRNPPAFVDQGDGLFTLDFQAGHAWRVEYQFELLGEGGLSRLIHDPLNPFITDDPFGGKSVVLRNGCADSIWLAEPRPECLGEFVEWPVDLTGPGDIKGVRQAAIWQPPACDASTVLPLLVFLDGTDYVRYGHLRRVLENMVGAGMLAPCRAVFIAPLKRNEEYAAHPAMPSWIEGLLLKVGEAVPLPERDQRFAVGTSLSALCLLHAQSVNPDVFGGLILQSGSYFQPTTDTVESTFPWFGRICQAVSHILDHGLGEPVTRIAATCGTVGENIRNNQRMMDTLTRAGTDVSFQTVHDAHNWTCWRNCVGDALVKLLPGLLAPSPSGRGPG